MRFTGTLPISIAARFTSAPGTDGGNSIFGDREENPCVLPSSGPRSTPPGETSTGSPGNDYIIGGECCGLKVFQITGTVAFAGYTLALWQMSIWYQRSWATTIRTTIDGLAYAALTGGVFGWLWPRA